MKRDYIFKGSFKNCILEYTNNSTEDEIKKLEQCINISNFTIANLLGGNFQLDGLRKLKCMYFLENYGYMCKELEILPNEVYVLGQLIANETVSIEKCSKSLGYISIYHLLEVFKNNQYIDLRKLNDYLRNFTTEHLSLNHSDKDEEFVPHLYDQKVDPLRHQAALEIFKHQVLSILPITEYLLSDKFSNEEREKLLRAIPNNGLFTLSQALQALCHKDRKDDILANGLFDKK